MKWIKFTFLLLIGTITYAQTCQMYNRIEDYNASQVDKIYSEMCLSKDETHITFLGNKFPLLDWAQDENTFIFKTRNDKGAVIYFKVFRNRTMNIESDDIDLRLKVWFVEDRKSIY